MSDTIPFAVSGDLTRLSHELEFVLRTLNVLEHGNPITRAQLELIVIGLDEAAAKARKLERLCEETPPPLLLGEDGHVSGVFHEVMAPRVKARRGDT